MKKQRYRVILADSREKSELLDNCDYFCGYGEVNFTDHEICKHTPLYFHCYKISDSESKVLKK